MSTLHTTTMYFVAPQDSMGDTPDPGAYWLVENTERIGPVRDDESIYSVEVIILDSTVTREDDL